MYEAATEDGVPVTEGAQFVIPKGWLRLTLDRSQSTGTFTRPGIAWFMKMLLTQEAPTNADELPKSLDAYLARANAVLEASELLEGLDLNTEAGAEEAWSRLENQNHLQETWAWQVGALALLVQKALDDDDFTNAVWGAQRLGIAWSMLVFLQGLEPLVWRGYEAHGLENLRELLQIWEEDRSVADEDFWHGVFDRFPFLASRVLAYPVVIRQSKAYVGGKTIANTGGEITDFLLSHRLTRGVAILELKVPTTPLLGSTYRDNVFPPSRELAGAVSQVVSQRATLVGPSSSLVGDEARASIFNPHCVVIVGDLASLDNQAKQRSFELYRSHLSQVTVITYDELFASVKAIVEVIESA
ncbi:MAG TPA: Shedu immune nuclease family protein [Actinomycetota bacterium]|nr:Shedu immune nuclease family protein [Actinomycetota bacterium]